MTRQLSRVDATVLPVGWTPAAVLGRTATEPEMCGSWSPALSPDGRHVAYVSDRGGLPRAWVQPVGSDVIFLVDTGPHPVVSVTWSSGGGWLACTLAPGGAPRTEVWLVRPDGTDLHQVAGFGADTACAARWLPGRPWLAVTENSARALVVDATTGERRLVAEDVLIDLLDVSNDGGRALLCRGPRCAEYLVLRDVTTGVERILAPGVAGCLAPDGRTVYARSDVDGEFAALVRVREGRIDVLAERPGAELDTFAVTADGATAALVWNVDGGLSELTLLDLLTGTQRPVGPLPGAVVTECAFAPDGQTLTFTAEGPGQPHGIWVTTEAGLRPVGPAAITTPAVAPQLRTVATPDGLTVTGWLYRPAGDGPHPTVLSLHAGPEWQERPGYNPLFASLVDRGIAVFAPNVRGSSGFGRTFVNADNGPGRYAAIADVAACVADLVAAGIAAPGRIACMGRSYGGYLTLAALVTYPELFAAGIDVCGMANFATFYAGTEPWIAAAAVSKYGDPVFDAGLLRDLSPITRIDRLAAPLLVVHGANDTNVPVCEAEQVVAALRERGLPHRYLRFDDEGHDFLNRTNRETYVEAAVGWVTEHLGVRTAGLLS